MSLKPTQATGSIPEVIGLAISSLGPRWQPTLPRLSTMDSFFMNRCACCNTGRQIIALFEFYRTFCLFFFMEFFMNCSFHCIFAKKSNIFLCAYTEIIGILLLWVPKKYIMEMPDVLYIYIHVYMCFKSWTWNIV